MVHDVAPVSWLTTARREDGRAKLNFSEWQRPQDADLEEVIDAIRDKDMPPVQYRLIHSEARLSDAERQQLERGLDGELGEGSARQVAAEPLDGARLATSRASRIALARVARRRAGRIARSEAPRPVRTRRSAPGAAGSANPRPCEGSALPAHSARLAARAPGPRCRVGRSTRCRPPRSPAARPAAPRPSSVDVGPASEPSRAVLVTSSRATPARGAVVARAPQPSCPSGASSRRPRPRRRGRRSRRRARRRTGPPPRSRNAGERAAVPTMTRSAPAASAAAIASAVR